MDPFEKLLREWIAADTRAASAEKRVFESAHGQAPNAALIAEAESLRAIAESARAKVANHVLTD